MATTRNRQASALRKIAGGLNDLASTFDEEALDEVLDSVKVPLLVSEADRDLWKQGRVLLALEGHGGEVGREEFYSFGDYAGYKRPGLGGFSTSPHVLVECKGERRILTDEGRARLQQAKNRWPDHFGAGAN